jgi:D-alanyl-D-alanine carboxypeptidase/D-alanyl-D-alanine-endopeptidase (penicillin-binding protein 4)
MRVKVGLIALPAALLIGMVPAAGAKSEGESFAPDLPARSNPAVSQSGAAASGSNNRRQLRRKLKKLAGKAPCSSGFYVVDIEAEGKRVLFDRKQGKRRRLASNTKLFTTATALNRLGADGRITTSVGARGRIENGRLKGDLFLIGGGDPSLGKSGLRTLAKAVKRSGIRKVKGDLFADDSVFDRKRGVPDSDFDPSPYLNPLSGLTYGGSTYSTDPALHAASAFKDRLRKRGVKVKGSIKRRNAPKRVEQGPLGSYRSATMARLVADTNKPSNNFYAEMLLKRIWAKPGRRGTTKGGTKAVERFARTLGAKVDARDGSGLTKNNKASPRDVVRLLSRMREHDAREAFHDSLARVGKEGTVDERMEGTPAARRCRAKTGTIDGVSVLSGYCNAGHGKVAFSLLMNGVGSVDAARQIQDRMTIEIAKYRP